MSNKNISLRESLSQLEAAVEEKDWQRAEALDSAIKQSVKEAVENVQDGQENTQLIDMLRKTQSLYSQLIASSEKARQEFSSELKKISNDNKAANFYLKSSQYR